MLKVFKLNTEEGLHQYKSLLISLDITEPYYLLDYIDFFSNGLEDLICFFFESNDFKSSILMPGYLKQVVIEDKTTSYFDFITPYGYTGPYFSKYTKILDISEFWNLVDKWYLENNVITEFIRFGLSENHRFYSGDIYPTMLNVKGKILNEENQWTSFDRKVRKNVNKAKRENLYSNVYYKNIEESKIVEFFDIYMATMFRTKAKESFHYSMKNFKNFIDNNSKHCAICTIYQDDIPISSELVLISKDSIYSFLGGTDDKFFDKRPNDFLKFELINWARKNNVEFYVLGGGYGFEDGIFKYKKAFFPEDVINYYTGRKIVDSKVYDELVEKISNLRVANGLKKLDKADTSFFPLYRLTIL